MPNVCGLTIEEAKKTLKELGVQANVINNTENSSEDENAEYEDKGKIVVEQLPKKGIQVNTNTTVTLYLN